MIIRVATTRDAEAICAIYNSYVTGSTITFEEVPVAVEEMQRRMAEVTTTLPWLVSESEGRVVGYAYATKWRVRSAYRFSVETTVYLDEAFCGRGIGRALYSNLIEKLRAAGIHRAIGGVALPNPASIALHEKLGFKKVAHFSEVGFKFGRWIDVAYWELAL